MLLGVNAVNIGLMGLGVVGSSVARILDENSTDLGACLKAVLVRDIDAHRSYMPLSAKLTSNPSDLLGNPEISVIIELMGGEQPAFDYICKALMAGKHVVTGNKEVLGKHGKTVFDLAKKNGVTIRFEASVGGGIPIVGALLNELIANNIDSIRAIINGTTNYILTKMANDGVDFPTALNQAQTLGYAETDPTKDIEGEDAAYKLAILASLAFNSNVNSSEIYHEGVTRLNATDFQYAAELGYVIKLLAVGKKVGENIQVRVHPAFISQTHALAKVDDVFNAVELEGDLVGPVMFQGRGAGALPTSSAVISDTMHVIKGIRNNGPIYYPELSSAKIMVEPMAQLSTQYYLRMLVIDKPGAMAQITKVLGDHNVSLSAVIQKGTFQATGLAEVVVTTHAALESSVRDAVYTLEGIDMVQEVSNLIRIEDVGT